MVMVCRNGFVNCVLCAEGSGCPEYRWRAKPAQPEQNGEEASTAKIKMVCICQRVKPVPEQSREVASAHGKKENNLERTELVALLESLRKATEAIQKLLKVVDKQVEDEKLSSAVLLTETTTTGGPDLEAILGKEPKIEDQSTEDELN
jgi:hypothetical protein